jgi:glycosyltransferase involved in cell wall biosynthesis
MTDPSTARPARLFTAFGTVLYVDAISGELRHGEFGASPANAYFVADLGSADLHHQGWLVHVSGSSREPIACVADGCYLISRSPNATGQGSPTSLELIPLERGLIAFRAGGHFLSAIPDGRIGLSAPKCSTWELFLASEHWCTDAHQTGDALWDAATGTSFDYKQIKNYIVHPTIRVRANSKPKNKKVLIYGYTKWSHGRVHYDLCKHLHRRGYIVDILDWQVNHVDYVSKIIPYYDLFMSACDGVRTLVDDYGIPYDKIIAVSHHELDIRMLAEQKGADVFEKFANYGVVSEFLYCASLMRGVTRVPMVASLGINYSEFCSDISEHLATVGYASSMSVKTYGVEWKRGDLAEAAAREAGLTFKVAGSTGNQMSFHDMPDFYRSVDAVVTSSISEAAQLPVMEAAAAGRLVIGTPVGHFPRKAYEGGGIIAPVEEEKFKTFTSATLRHYRDNPAAYVDKCRSIQVAARKFDWQHSIGEWVELIEAATTRNNSRSKPDAIRSFCEPADPLRTPEETAESAEKVQRTSSIGERLSNCPAKIKKGIVCDIDWLFGYIAHEHYYLIMLLKDRYGFDIINSKAVDFRSADVIGALNKYDVLLIAYQGYVDISTDKISAYKIFKIDDLVSYDETYDRLAARLIAGADMIVSPYAYAFSQFFKHTNVVWLPYSSAIESYSDVSFNHNPIRKVIVSGSVAWDRPFRQYAATLKSKHIELLDHPGYHNKYDGYGDATVGERYYREINKYLCGFADAHTYRYLHLKVFEIASVGSLLLADKLVESEMNELGFFDFETCIFSDKENFLEKISWICDQRNAPHVDKIRRAGMELVRARHLTQHRAKQLNEIVNNAIAQECAGRSQIRAEDCS